FFFQAEDGIRGRTVTGVQTCALPISFSVSMQHQARSLLDYDVVHTFKDFMKEVEKVTSSEILEVANEIFAPEKISTLIYEAEKRSEERRVGKGCRSRMSRWE